MFRKEFLVCTLGNRLLNIQQHKALKCSSEVLRAQKSISYQNTFKIYLQSYSASDQPGQSTTTLAFWGLVISSFSFYEFIYYIFQCYFQTSKNHPQILSVISIPQRASPYTIMYCLIYLHAFLLHSMKQSQRTLPPAKNYFIHVKITNTSQRTDLWTHSSEGVGEQRFTLHTVLHKPKNSKYYILEA